MVEIEKKNMECLTRHSILNVFNLLRGELFQWAEADIYNEYLQRVEPKKKTSGG